MDNYDTIIAGYMHPSMKQLVSYDANTNTGILYAGAWKPVGVFKVVKGKDVFQKSFENYVNTTRCMNVVTLKNVIDYANTNFERSLFHVGECNGSYKYPSQPFVLRVATLTVSEYETFCE